MMRKFLTLLLLLWALPLSAAITHDADSASVETTSGTTVSWTHTVGAGLSNSILVVGASYGANAGAANPVVSVKIGATNFTKVGASTEASTNDSTEIWYLLNPPSGAQTIVITYTNALTAATSALGGASSFSGVDQTSPIDASTGATGTTGTASATLTTVANNAWVMASLIYNDDTVDPLASNTAAWNVDMTSGVYFGEGQYKGPVTPAGSTTLSWANGTSNWAVEMISLKPSGAGGGGATPVPQMMMSGVGRK